MVKKFAILLFCGFLTLSIQAQNFGGGLIAGVSTSQVAGDMLGGFNKIGLLAGVYTNLKVKENLSFKFDVMGWAGVDVWLCGAICEKCSKLNIE